MQNARASNGSHEKELLTVLDPTVGSTWLIISIFGWLKNRGKKVKTKQASKQKVDRITIHKRIVDEHHTYSIT
jgi:hypothetical protein